MTGRVDRVDRDQSDGGVLGTVRRGGDVTLADVDGELHAELHAIVQRADHKVGVHHLDVVAGLDLASGNLARAGGGEHHPLGAFTVHAERELLDVQHDVGDVFTHTKNAAELVQHAVDLNGRDGSAL